MTILVDKKTKLLVQGVTGKEGSFHTKSMISYGTNILAGVTPGKAGARLETINVYDSVYDAKTEYPEINASIIFVPAPFAADAVYEAIDAKISLIALISERIPSHDAIKFIDYARMKDVIILGPNCPGVISPEESKVGIMPSQLFKKGRIGVISRSGTLTYEIAWALTRSGLGQSTALGIGGDPVTGINFLEALNLFEADIDTDAIVVIGEIGGDAEERLADHVINRKFGKPLVAFIAGKSAPPGKRMGHAGAIISAGSGTAEGKVKKFLDAGIPVATKPSDVPSLISSVLNKG